VAVVAVAVVAVVVVTVAVVAATIIIIIIIITLVITSLHGIYSDVPKTNHVSTVYVYCCSYSVFTVCATWNVILLVKYVLFFYISTSRSMCAVWLLLLLLLSLSLSSSAAASAPS
jgi:hypothetical protein